MGGGQGQIDKNQIETDFLTGCLTFVLTAFLPKAKGGGAFAEHSPE